MILRILLLIFACTQALAPSLPNILGFGRMIDGSGAGRFLSIIPAGYTFAIWGPIFFGCIAFALYCLFHQEVSQSLIIKYIIIFALITLWSLVVSFTNIFWLPVVVFIVAALLLISTIPQLLSIPDLNTGKYYRIILVPLLLFVGWCNTAFWLNIGTAMIEYNFRPFSITWDQLSLILLIIIAIYHYTTIGIFKLPTPVIATYLWASIGVFFALSQKQPNSPLFWITCMHICILTTLTGFSFFKT